MINWKLFEWEKCFYLPLPQFSVVAWARKCMCVWAGAYFAVREFILVLQTFVFSFFIHSVYFFFQTADEIANTMTRMSVAAAATAISAVAVAATHVNAKQIQPHADTCRSAGANCETETKSSREWSTLHSSENNSDRAILQQYHVRRPKCVFVANWRMEASHRRHNTHKCAQTHMYSGWFKSIGPDVCKDLQSPHTTTTNGKRSQRTYSYMIPAQ